MLAKAGLNRLGLEAGALIPISEILPAVGQGALGIECRENDVKILDLLKPLSHTPSEAATACERTFLRAVDGSCRLPIAGYAVVEKSLLRFEGFIAEADGTNSNHISLQGAVKDAEAIGFKAGKEILEKN
jgi:hydroxymethylbilane synthase